MHQLKSGLHARVNSSPAKHKLSNKNKKKREKKQIKYELFNYKKEINIIKQTNIKLKQF